MNDPRTLLNRGLGLIQREMEKLERAEDLQSAQRDDLCAYMNVLHKLVGKDLGDDQNFAELTDSELQALVLKHLQSSNTPRPPNKRRKQTRVQNNAGKTG